MIESNIDITSNIYLRNDPDIRKDRKIYRKNNRR